MGRNLNSGLIASGSSKEDCGGAVGAETGSREMQRALMGRCN